jgi:hypothetical protein
VDGSCGADGRGLAGGRPRRRYVAGWGVSWEEDGRRG